MAAEKAYMNKTECIIVNMQRKRWKNLQKNFKKKREPFLSPELKLSAKNMAWTMKNFYSSSAEFIKIANDFKKFINIYMIYLI